MGNENRTELSPAEIAGELEREPLIGVTAASKLLGIPSTNFKRDARPHLTPVPVEGTAMVFFRSEVVELAKRRENAPLVLPPRDARGKFSHGSENGSAAA